MVWPGRYFDGHTTQRHEVDVSLSGAALHFRLKDGTALQWPLDRIIWTESPGDSAVSRLCLTTDLDARLEFRDPDFVGALRRQFPGIDRVSAAHKRPWRSAFIAGAGCLVLAGVLFGVASILPSILAPSVSMSVKKQISEKVIQAIDPVFRRVGAPDPRLCLGAAGQAALERLLSRFADADKRVAGIAVTVINSKAINTLAVPDERVVVFNGMIHFVTTPDEFAGVLAHVIGHSLHQHPTKAAVREIGLGMMFDLALGGTGLTKSAARQLVRTAYSPDSERAADDTAVKILKAAGLPTSGLVTVFDLLARQRQWLPRAKHFFSTHPISEDRAAHIKGRSGTLEGLQIPEEDWQAIQEICE